MSGSSFEDLFWIGVFFAAIYIFGRIPRMFGFSPIVGEIAAGVIFGPPLLDIVPLYRVFGETGEPIGAVNETSHRLLASSPGSQGTIIWVMLGQLGVTLLIVESGLHAEFSTLRRVGSSAAVVAVMGTLFPLAGGIAFATLLGFDPFPDGVAIGSALAPTSVGIALKLLQEAKQLNSQFGQTIVTAAFIDDVLSLVALAVLLQLGSGQITPWGVASPFLYSILFIGGAVLIAYKPAPFIVNKTLDFITEHFPHNGKSHGPADEVHLTFMLLVVLLYTFIGSLVGSHLLGAFVSGVTFCSVPRSMLVWTKQLKRIESWLIRLFFAATVGFSIPIQSMLTLESFWKGLVVTIVPTILGKVLSGMFQGDRRWVIGWSMVGRGEFSFLVAETSRTTLYLGASSQPTYLLSKDAYGVVVWALLLATIVTPFAFRHVLNRQQRADENSAASKLDDEVLEKNQNVVGKWNVTVRAVHGYSGLSDVLGALRALNYTVTSVEVQSDGVFAQESFLIVPTTEAPLPLKKPSALGRRGSFGILSKSSKSSLVGEERFKDPFYHEDPDYSKEKIRKAVLDAIDDRTGSVTVEIEPCPVEEKHAHKSFTRPALHQLSPLLDVSIHERLREASVHGGSKFDGDKELFHTTITHNEGDEKSFDILYQQAHNLASSRSVDRTSNNSNGSLVHSMNSDPEAPSRFSAIDESEL